MKRIVVTFFNTRKTFSMLVKDWKVVDDQLVVINRDGGEVQYPGKVREVCEKCEVE